MALSIWLDLKAAFGLLIPACLLPVLTLTVLEEHCNPRLIKELLQDLSSTLQALTKGVGKCVLVGSVNVWLCRLDVIHNWQKQLNHLHIPKVVQVLGGKGYATVHSCAKRLQRCEGMFTLSSF